MDAFLLVSSIGLARNIRISNKTTIHHNDHAKLQPLFASVYFFQVVFFQSLILFSLATVEVISVRFSSLLLFLDRYDRTSRYIPRLSIVSAYTLNLRLLSLSLILCPTGIILHRIGSSRRSLSNVTNCPNIGPRLTNSRSLPITRTCRERPLLMMFKFIIMCIVVIYVGRAFNSQSLGLRTMLQSFYYIGILLSTIIDAVGSVLLPYKYLSGLFLRSIKDEDIHRVEEEYRLACRMYQDNVEDYTHACNSNTVKRNRFYFGKNNKIHDSSEYAAPSLKVLIRDLQDDIEEMKETQTYSSQAKTFFGKIKAVLGLGFAVILIIRIFMAVSTSRKSDRRDPISTILLWCKGHKIISKSDYVSLSEVVSLILSVFLSTSQIRTFIRIKNSLAQCWVKHSVTNSITEETSITHLDDYVAILATCMMGCYFWSCVVVIKRTLPHPYHQSFLKSIGDRWFEINDRGVSVAFTISALLGMGSVVIMFAMKRFISNRTIDLLMHPHEKV